MAVGGQEYCVCMDIVGGKGFLPKTLQGNNYILNITDCFKRNAIAIFLPDQSSSVIISAINGNLNMVYVTHRSILYRSK